MISILVYIAVATILGMGADNPTQEASTPDISRTIGVCTSFEYLEAYSSCIGFSIAGFIRPVAWTEVGMGYILLADSDNRYSYIGNWIGLYSPKLYKLQFTCGAAYDVRADAESDNWSDEGPLLQSGVSLYTGVDATLKDNPNGYQYNLRTKVFFRDNSVGRISAGFYILN
ncbi:MAG: hypothetical protein K8S62_05265 [Candidatus Sabulitectum sp.]|nr:hypothetical protein [Candidatus Sabulitectum sp.]